MNDLTNIDRTKRVEVYRNLNKPGCQFSVRQGGRVRCYVDSIVLQDARFKHATSTQLHQVRSGARQVCQWISGIINEKWVITEDAVRVSCDPKTADGFVVAGKRIDTAAFVAVSKTGCFAIPN